MFHVRVEILPLFISLFLSLSHSRNKFSKGKRLLNWQRRCNHCRADNSASGIALLPFLLKRLPRFCSLQLEENLSNAKRTKEKKVEETSATLSCTFGSRKSPMLAWINTTEFCLLRSWDLWNSFRHKYWLDAMTNCYSLCLSLPIEFDQRESLFLTWMANFLGKVRHQNVKCVLQTGPISTRLHLLKKRTF